MGRKGNLEVTRDKQSRKWVVNICPQLSTTGKRSRKKFATKVEAENYRKNLTEALGSKKLPTYNEDLLVTAHYYNEAFQLHGYKNLEEACDAWMKELETPKHLSYSRRADKALQSDQRERMVIWFNPDF